MLFTSIDMCVVAYWIMTLLALTLTYTVVSNVHNLLQKIVLSLR